MHMKRVMPHHLDLDVLYLCFATDTSQLNLTFGAFSDRGSIVLKICLLSCLFQELERKFSQTGAYKNMKMMLSSKNDQVAIR